MTEGGISAWKKAEGESFAPGDVLLEMVSILDARALCTRFAQTHKRGAGHLKADSVPACSPQETDKASMDVEAQDEGILVKILVSDSGLPVALGRRLMSPPRPSDWRRFKGSQSRFSGRHSW